MVYLSKLVSGKVKSKPASQTKAGRGGYAEAEVEVRHPFLPSHTHLGCIWWFLTPIKDWQTQWQEREKEWKFNVYKTPWKCISIAAVAFGSVAEKPTHPDTWVRSDPTSHLPYRSGRKTPASRTPSCSGTSRSSHTRRSLERSAAHGELRFPQIQDLNSLPLENKAFHIDEAFIPQP